MADDGSCNPTDNRPFDDVLRARIGRRAVLGGSLATAAATFLGASPALAGGRTAGAPGGRPAAAPSLDFPAIPLSTANEVRVAAGHTATPFLPWGTPILPGAAATTYPISAEDQERRIGLGHDGMWFFPTAQDASRGVLCLNLEFGTNEHLLRGLQAEGVAMDVDSLDFVRLSQAAHGVAVVEIERAGASWQVVAGSPRNRRITANTPVTFSGPAAGSPLLQNPAGNPFAGTVNNCANGKTPWGTYLTCEENFNGYFGATGDVPTGAAVSRYGFSAGGFGYGWHRHDRRFDLSDPAHANERNRFGWVVEIDPMDPSAPPVKRTALGRVKHENAEVVVGRGDRVVVYMGDDERFDYVYKFVSAASWRSLRARGQSPLDHGTLHVARFDDDGTGTWLPLTPENPALAGFGGLDEILVHTRLAADAVGATPMDRPEWAAADPTTGAVYITMTNNTRRTTPNGPNPRTPNPWGHIVQIVDGHQHVGSTFRWDVFLLAGPAGQAGSTTDPNSEHGSPDGLAFAADGTMVIQTDGSQPGGANDQMLLADPRTGQVKRFLTGVRGCEVTGWTPLDAGTQLVNLQHPGDGDPAVSSWPSPDGSGAVPRDACVVVTKVG